LSQSAAQRLLEGWPMTASMHRTLVVTNLPKSVPALLSRTRAVLTAMTGNPSFPTPNPSLAALASALAALEGAETAVQSRTRGTRAARDEKRVELVALFGALRGYVQSVADGNQDNAASIIESAGLSIKRPAVQTKPPFAVKPGRVSGSVVLAVRSAGDRASYAWQWSTDGGLTWHDAPQTTQTTKEIADLPVGGTCWFRVRVVSKDGQQDWCESLSSLVT
jgi:hypothetical protein